MAQRFVIGAVIAGAMVLAPAIAAIAREDDGPSLSPAGLLPPPAGLLPASDETSRALPAPTPEPSTAAAGAQPRPADPDRAGRGELPYRTPRAGRPHYATVLGREVYVPERDRANVLSITLGIQLLTPNVGGQTFLPIGAIYARQHWEEHRRRIRATIAGVVNDVLFEDGTWNDEHVEFVAAFNNDTVPVATTEVVDGDELEGSDLEWGTVIGGIGFGMRWHLRPYNFENDFRLQVLYELGYFYNDRVSETDRSVDLPPDTPLHQLHFKMRGDAFERNLFEMIHRGYAMGGDLVFGHRQRWSDSGAAVIDNVVFRRNDRNQNYLRLSGYLALATGLPNLSERHTFLAFTHAGWAPNGNVDRFNAFRRGGGPPNTQESEDLARHPFPGAFIEAVPMERYVFVTMEYRYELAFFFYLHFRTTFARARIPEIKGNGQIKFDDETSWASSFGITTGVPILNAQAYIEYAYTTDDFQRDDDGHGFLLVISKSF